MATFLITNSNAESKNPDTGLPDQPITSSNPFQKIDFHLAKKPFAGFMVNGGGGGFRLETLNPTTPASSQFPQKAGGGSNQVNGTLPGNGKTRDGSEFPENGLDQGFALRVHFRRIGAGLENLGNTCFLNSVLQCLTYTEPLAAYLQSSRHQTSCRCAGFCALCAMQKHVSRAIQMPGRSLAPKDLVSNLRCISRSFRNSRQEDAHEYMVNLLESMHKCCLPSGVPSESPSAYEKSLVHKIFGGRLRSQVKCMQCSFCSDKFDPFLDLSLEIVKADNVNKALANFTAKEQLDGGERQYQCQQCKQKVKALKQLTIHKAPNILTIHLKRFGSHISGQKIDKKIHFAPTLDLKPFVTGPYDEDLKYTLYGVLVHAGWSTHSGHYYCFVRPSSGLWYSLDDNKVVQVSERKVFEQKAYMLFYCRDRKSYGSKKAVDVMQNEMIMNGITKNGTYSHFNGVGADIRSDMIARTSNALNSSAAVAQRDTLTTGASVESTAKEAPAKQIDCSKLSSELIKESCPETSPKATPLQSVIKGLSTLHQKADPSLPLSSLSVAGPIDVLKTEDGMNMQAGSKFVDCSLESRTKRESGNFNAIPSSCNYSEVTETMKDKREALPLSRNGNCSTNERLGDSPAPALPINHSIEPSSIGDVCTAEKTSIKVEGFSSKHTDVAADDSQRKLNIVSAVLPSVPETNSISLKEKSHNKKPYRKLKNSFMSCQVTSIHLGSNILIGTSLSLWKKKKHKRSKKRARCVKNLNQEHLVGLGPSSSEELKTLTVGRSAHTLEKGLKRRKGEKSDVEKSSVRILNKDTSVNAVDREFRERVSKPGPMLATVDGFEKSSSDSLRRSLSDNKGENSSTDSQRSPTQNGFTNMASQRDLRQNGFLNMLTRGLEETTIARWDGVESTPVRMMESNVKKSVSIGYVADEWDEEYDRGKRKKVRMSKDRFDGQNPFQEIATKKAKLNHAKLDQYRSGNRPFRI